MNSGLIAGLAAVSGSFVGALGSVVGTWITTRHQDLRDLLAKRIVRREALYSDFITESARLLVDALEHNTSDPQKLIPAYALLSRIRLSSSSRVKHCSFDLGAGSVRLFPPRRQCEQADGKDREKQQEDDSPSLGGSFPLPMSNGDLFCFPRDLRSKYQCLSPPQLRLQGAACEQNRSAPSPRCS
jgi:hypothetical protein